MSAAPFWPALHGKCQRHAARYFFTRPVAINTSEPIVSFTFDDFPRSALHTGGAILEQFGVRGTYYASFGLMGTTGPTGRIFDAHDIAELLDRGHELGCHTYHHCHSWNTRTDVFERSLIANERTLSRSYAGASFKTFSYPLSPPRPFTKRSVANRFQCARGGGQTFNTGTADLNYLRGYFLEKAAGDRAAVERVIRENASAGGWLILATHDVSDSPTEYGCRTEFFEAAVRSAVASGSRVVPVAEAAELLTIDRR